MNSESFFSKQVKKALKNPAPGSWMAKIPENCIKLSSGYPHPSLVPVKELQEAVNQLIEEEQDLPFHYIGSPRVEKVKEHIQKRLNVQGMHVSNEEILVTSGACQAIDLIARIILDENVCVIVESPTYMEALEIFQNYTNHIIAIPIDGEGLQTEALESLLKDRQQNGLVLPKLLYTIPTFQNPTGTTLSLERRQHVLRLASEYDFVILEDNAYGELAFQSAPPTLKALDKEDRVIYVGSFSKIVAPGLRIGWIAATQKFIEAAFWFKKDLDHTYALATLAMYLENNDLSIRLQQIKPIYDKRCQLMLTVLRQYLPAKATWYIPEGGYFVWIKIPSIDTSVLLKDALAAGVSYVPGKYFFLDPKEGLDYLRVSFSFVDEEKIIEGIKILGKLLSEAMISLDKD